MIQKGSHAMSDCGCGLSPLKEGSVEGKKFMSGENVAFRDGNLHLSEEHFPFMLKD